MTDNNNSFLTYLELWKSFLEKLINENLDNFGIRVKYQRQLQAISDVLYGVPFNIRLFRLMIDLYNNEVSRPPMEPLAPYLKENCHTKNYFLKCFGAVGAGRNAVDRAIDSDPLFLVQGPPGTGKTSVIAEIMLQTLRHKPDSRIVIASETHAAVDNALEKLIEHIAPENFSVLRYPNTKYQNEILEQFTLANYIKAFRDKLNEIDTKLSHDIVKDLELDNLAYLDEDDDFEEIDTSFKYIHKYVVENISVLGITCNHLGRFSIEAGDPPWDLVIIDEVSKATLPEIFLALMNAKRAVLVGDPMQLPPTFCKEEFDAADQMGYGTHVRLIKNSLVDALYENAPEQMKAFLDTQYRMTNEIGTIVSHTFYEEKLINGRNESIENSVVLLDYQTERKFPNRPVKQGGILENEIEADLILEKINQLESTFPLDTKIAVITPYKRQKRLLQRKLSSTAFKHIEIDTIDAFQGREAKIVFLSLTRNNGSYIFFSDSRRLNVAISRAQDYLYIVGSRAYLRKVEILRKLIDGLD